MSRARRRLLAGTSLAVAALTALAVLRCGANPHRIPEVDAVGARLCAGYGEAVGPTRAPFEAFSGHAGLHREGSRWAWDDFMERLGVVLHRALGAESAALERLVPLKPAEHSWAPKVGEAIATDHELIDALVAHDDRALIQLLLLRYEFARDWAERGCGYLQEENARLEADKRACEKNRGRNLQDWWTVRCVWEPPRA